MKNKHKSNLPAAYISGHQEFYGLDFLVNKHTLIPRPDTVSMVDEAKKFIANSSQPIVLIDVGTGTGCVPIAIMKIPTRESGSRACLGTLNDGCHSEVFSRGISTKNRGGDPSHPFGMTVIATDISRDALAVAKKNAKIHGAKIDFLQGNLLEPISKGYTLHDTGYTIITANLPYLAEKWYNSEPSIQHEPKTALVGGGQDGLLLYKKLFEQINTALTMKQFNPDARSGSRACLGAILIEIDPRQSEAASTLVKKYLPNFSLEIKKDLGGRDRLIIITNNQDTRNKK